MSHYLQCKIAQLRFVALLMLVVCGINTTSALESDDINTAILVEGSVPPTWTNDATNPWYIVENTDGTSYIRTPETAENSNFSTTLSFSYTSSYPTELTFEWSAYSTYSHPQTLIVKIDGEEKMRDDNYSWESLRYMIPTGTHTIDFISGGVHGVDDARIYTAIRNLRILECKELETACLKEGSLPLTFENDPDNMWITDNGYIRSTRNINGGTPPSKITSTFTIDKPSVFSFEYKDYNYTGDYGYNTAFTLDGIVYGQYRSEDWKYISVVLYPGTHTIEFENWYSSTKIRNVCLDQTWYEVTLSNPGELGNRLIQALNGKNLQDAELVKIKGSMNSADWEIIGQLDGVKAIDFTGSTITEIPTDGMRGLSYLSTVMLPGTLKTIKSSAFRGTKMYQITIPASVETIEYEAWYQVTNLRFITFEKDSKLSYIGYAAFYNTDLREFIMPDAVTEIGYAEYHSGLFANCTSLKKLHLSENLSTVRKYLAKGCSALKEVNIPINAKTIEEYAFYETGIKNIEIPTGVTSINYCAFQNSALESLTIPASVSYLGDSFAAGCKALKEVTLNSHCWDMNSYFDNCTALEKVVLPCATPPSIKSEPFYNVNKENIQLFVPDFALASYKADPYWYQFKSAQVSEEASVNDYWAIRGNLTLDGSHVMRGIPSVEMITGGTLVMEDDATQNFDTFTYNTSESTPAAFLSKSNAVSANKLETRFYVESSNKWYFFSPLTDVNMSDITYPATDSWVIRYYDGARRASENTTSGNWVNVPADGTLHRGQGYIIQARAAGWLYMPAATTEHAKFFGSNEETLALADNACETPENAGWNFVANPYPSFYDIYYIQMQAPITVWTGSTYRAYSLNDGDRGDDTFVLRPMQPYFVQKDNSELTAGMPLMGRQIDKTINRDRAPGREPEIDENRLKLNLELYRADNEEADDYTRIVINESAKTAYETNCDASKFMSLDNEVAQLYSLGDNSHPMAINERPYDDGYVALGVYLPAKGETYCISARRADRKAWIFDATTGVEHDLTSGDYYFTTDKVGVDNKRFTIRFAPHTTTVNDLDAVPVKVVGNEGYITVSTAANSTVLVYATDGTMIANVKAEGGMAEIPAAAGIYIVKVNGKTVKTIVK